MIATALLGGTASADAVPRRVAFLDFDGPRALAEIGRDAVVRAIGEDNDANFVIPLPASLYVRGELTYTRIETSFDGVGVITEHEAAFEAVDSNVGASVKVGIEL